MTNQVLPLYRMTPYEFAVTATPNYYAILYSLGMKNPKIKPLGSEGSTIERLDDGDEQTPDGFTRHRSIVRDKRGKPTMTIVSEFRPDPIATLTGLALAAEPMGYSKTTRNKISRLIKKKLQR